MIEKMKVVHIVAAQTQKTELLDALRALGIVHFAEKADADQTYLERFAALSRLITVLEEQGVSEVEAETLDDVKFKQLYDGLNACLERKKALETERAAAVSACDTLADWGSFSPAEIKVDAERAQEWIKTGAQPTDTVRALLKKVNAL